MVAMAAGVAFALVGLAVRPLHFLYDYAWFVGFFTAGMVYAALMKMSAPAGDKG
jgi:NCS1 family nucleobase:cation symporter-1